MLVRTEAFIDKFVGDEVMAVYLPVFCGPNHARAAVDSAHELLKTTARSESHDALPVGRGSEYGQLLLRHGKGGRWHLHRLDRARRCRECGGAIGGGRGGRRSAR